MSRAALLSLVQWLSPAFPTGAFAFSHGLEQVIADGAVTDAPSLEQWLRAVLEHGAGWQDAVLLAQALRAGADMNALDALARALQPSAERLAESCDQGAALARTVAAMTGRALPARLLPVALGEAAAPLRLPPGDVIALYLHGFAG
ncbi:MAG: urease accessory protein UreF, partial [Roseovarius sp.]